MRFVESVRKNRDRVACRQVIPYCISEKRSRNWVAWDSMQLPMPLPFVPLASPMFCCAIAHWVSLEFCAIPPLCSTKHRVITYSDQKCSAWDDRHS
ncbi:MAG: hypothetical protein AAFO04_28285 [Cyanobacteria bacterium J06592_8]